MPASPSTRSITPAAMCSWPGGLVVSRRMSSRASSTTDDPTIETLADRGDREPPGDRCPQRLVPAELGVGLDQQRGLVADIVEQVWLQQPLHGCVRHAVLPGAHQLPHAPPAHVLPCQRETG